MGPRLLALKLTSKARGAKLGIAGAALLGLASASSPLLADAPPGLKTTLLCAGDKSIALCTVAMESTPGSRITYAEVNLLKEPAFLKPANKRSTFSEEKSVRPKLKLLFVPQAAGTGQVVAQVQAVVCLNNGQACPHFQRVLTANVSVPP
jgi:hypothetical protein